MQNRNRLSRRRLFQAGAAGLGFGVIKGWPAPADSTGKAQRLSARFRTDPERIARMLPPPLEPADAAEVIIQYSSAVPEDSARSVILPGPFASCHVVVAVKRQDRPALLHLGGWTSWEWGRLNGREFAGQNVKDGLIRLDREDDRIKASLHRQGRLIHRLETKLAGKADDSPSWRRARDQPVFSYRYRLSPDWAEDLLGDVELWDIRRIEADLEGAGSETGPRTGDLGQTLCEWVEGSVLDPYIEFPVTELLEVFYEEGVLPLEEAARPSETRRPALVSKVGEEAFKPWAFLNYDRPVTERQPWLPGGWRETATAFKLAPPEIERYQQRKEIRLARMDLVDVQVAVEKEVHAACLPPPCEPGARPVLRIVGLRVESSDLSPAPFHEMWLFAYCLVANQGGWYALSHIVGPGGDVIFGRETFGYPSKTGDPSLAITPGDFSVQGRRLGREFFYAEGAFRGMSTGTSLARFNIFSLRAGPFGSRGPSAGQIIWQPWHFQGTQSYVDRESVIVELPDRPAAEGIGKPDPWFEFSPFRVISAGVMIHAGMQRGPGRVVAEFSDAAPYYRERCDGLLPGGDKPESLLQPTFRANDAPATQS